MEKNLSQTALITGATNGIGLEFANIFAKNGINLILVARNETQLKTISSELSANNINASFYAQDLSRPENAQFIYDDLKTKNIRIDYLVNNAGFGINEQFIDIDWNKELEMYNLNMLTLSYFTKVFSKDMKQNGFGRILNVASMASFQPGPYMAGYCATKAFVLSLSQAVNHELRGSNVSVSTLCPGVTDSLFHVVAKSEETGMTKHLSHASPKEVAIYGYKIMMKGKSMGIYGLSNKLIVFSNRLISRKLTIYISGLMLRKG